MASHQIVIAYNNDTQKYCKFWMILSDTCGRKPVPQLEVHDILLPGINQSFSNANGRDMLLEATSEGRNGSVPHHPSISTHVPVGKDSSPNNMVKVQHLNFISRTENAISTPPDQRISAWKFKLINQTRQSLGAQSLAIAGEADRTQPRCDIQSPNRAAFDTEIASGTLGDTTIRSNNGNVSSGLGIGQVQIEVRSENLSPAAALVKEAAPNDTTGSHVEAQSDEALSAALATHETSHVPSTEMPNVVMKTEAVVANAGTEAVRLTKDSDLSGSSTQTANVSPDQKKRSHESVRTAVVATENRPAVGERTKSLGAAADEEPAQSMEPNSPAVRLGEGGVTPAHPAVDQEAVLIKSTPSRRSHITSAPLLSADASIKARSAPRFVRFFRRHVGKLSIITIVGGIAMKSFSFKSSSGK